MQKMFGVAGNHLIDDKALYILFDNKVILIISLICATPLIKKIGEVLNGKNERLSVSLLKYILLIAIFMLCLCAIAVSTYNPFIYFNF